MDMFFVTKEFFGKADILPHDNSIDMYEIRNSIFCHKFPHKNKTFRYNQQHLHFYHNNMLPYASFYMVSTLHDDNFFNICAWSNSIFFNIFYHIGKPVFTRYILQSYCFYHTRKLLRFLHGHTAYISLYGKVEDIDEGNTVPFFCHKFAHKNEAQYPFHTKAP